MWTTWWIERISRVRTMLNLRSWTLNRNLSRTWTTGGRWRSTTSLSSTMAVYKKLRWSSIRMLSLRVWIGLICLRTSSTATRDHLFKIGNPRCLTPICWAKVFNITQPLAAIVWSRQPTSTKPTKELRRGLELWKTQIQTSGTKINNTETSLNASELLHKIIIVI